MQASSSTGTNYEFMALMSRRTHCTHKSKRGQTQKPNYPAPGWIPQVSPSGPQLTEGVLRFVDDDEVEHTG